MATNQINITPEASVYTWLNSYVEKISSMTEQERREENRADYIEESQLYPDYLDYVEEWEWHQKEQKHSLLQSFILAQSKTHRKMECTCEEGEHVFTTMKEPEKGDVITDSPALYIYGKCWYKTLSIKVDEVLEQLKQPQIRLPKTIESIMIQVSRWRMVTSEQTPFLLPYEAFEKIWWDKSITGKTSETAKALLSQLSWVERDQIKIMKSQNESQIPKHKWKKLLDFPHSDHGLHALKDAISEANFQTVWSFMNKWRTKIQPQSAIDISELERKISKCKLCQKGKYPAALSNPGVYYAPPGCGKTTAQNKELLVGLDTDWIGVGPTWADYSPIFNMKIPIITNQYTIFEGSGFKVIGVTKKNVRKDSEGRPLTTQRELDQFERKHPQGVIFTQIPSKKFVSDYATHLQLTSHLQKLIKNFAINLLPFYTNEMNEEWLNKYPKLLRKDLQT